MARFRVFYIERQPKDGGQIDLRATAARPGARADSGGRGDRPVNLQQPGHRQDYRRDHGTRRQPCGPR